MTRTRTYVLTALAVALYLSLSWAFEDNLFTGRSLLFTLLLAAAIVAAGVVQALRMTDMPPRDSPADAPSPGLRTPGHVDDPRLWKLATGNAYYAILWMPLRFYAGRYWLSAGENKLREDAWMGGGTALRDYWTRAVEVQPEGNPAITYPWYRDFIQYMLDNSWYSWFAKVVAIGETLVGIALILGAFAGIAAFFGIFMNFNYMLAGSSSANPILFLCGLLLVLGWKVAGFWGLDRWLLPMFGAPWKAETVVVPSPGVRRERERVTA